MIQLQIGKKGLTKEFLEDLKIRFKNEENIRVSVLKSGSRDKEQLLKWKAEILNFLGINFTCNIIGYTLVIRKWRKARTPK